MPDIVYLDGDFLPKDRAHISPSDRGFLFSDGVYEALCAFDGALFLADEHFVRLQRSLHELRIETDLTAERFAEVARALVERNDLAGTNAKVYFQVTRGAPPERHHAFPTTPTAPTVYATASRYDLPEAHWGRGVEVLLCPDERWGRCDIKSVSLLPNVLANQHAAEAGAFEAVLVRPEAGRRPYQPSTGQPPGSQAVVTEGSHSSFAAVVDGTLVTHPLGPRVLPGVTRGFVLKLAREEGVPVREEPLHLGPMRAAADELMLLGTTTGVMPVTSVASSWGDGGWRVGDGQPGPVTRQLQAAFRAAFSEPQTATLEAAAFLEATG